MAADFDDVLLDGSAREPENAADIGGAFALLNPSEAFELALCDLPQDRSIIGLRMIFLRKEASGLKANDGVLGLGQRTGLRVEMPPNRCPAQSRCAAKWVTPEQGDRQSERTRSATND